MARTTITMEEELRDKLVDLQGAFRVDKNYEVIERLIKEYKDFQEFRVKKEKEIREQHVRIDREMLVMGTDRKKTYMTLKKELGLASDVSVLDFLLVHYENSPSIDKRTFEVFRNIN